MRRELLLLREMRDAADAVRDVIRDLPVQQLETDSLRRAALLWHFTVLGEAASQVPAQTKELYPDIAWRAATRLRNRIVHGYWDIDIEVLFATAIEDLPSMIDQLDRAIADVQKM